MGVIDGTVVSATTNQAVAGARVLAVPEGVATGAYSVFPVIADTSGHFVISGLSPGRYRLEAHADDFVTQAYGARAPQLPGKLVEVGPGQHVSDVTFHIFPCGAISGTVRDENGKPVAGATVRALSVHDRHYFQTAGTNRQGVYRVSNLDPGPYILQVSYPRLGGSDETHLLPGGLESIEREPETTEVSKKPPTQNVYACTYYPNVTDPTAASSVAVQPGIAQPNMDIEMRSVRTVRVRGHLINGVTGKPAPSGLVGLTARINSSAFPGGGAANEAVALYSNVTVEVKDPSGRFEFGKVPSGSYWAEGQISGDDKTLTGLVSVEVGDTNVEGVLVEAGDGVELKGQVRVERGTAFDFSGLSISLGWADLPLPYLKAPPSTNGAFAFEYVPPATYSLIVKNLPSGYYLNSARFGGVDVLDAGVTLGTGSSGQLDILLSSPGGTISGQVQEGDKPVPATVYLAPYPLRLNRADLYFSIPTNGDGTFTLTGIPPGNYKVFAFRDPDPNLISNPALFESFEPKGESVGVDDGSSQSVKLELISAADQE
ncbi:MAG TPA: carboxypeptidase-like regulatory domain-containing protein [Terriglobia bacterium]